MNKFKKLFIGFLFFSLISTFTFKVKAEESFQIGQIPYISFFCKDQESMLAIAEADASNLQQSNLVSKMLTQFGQCISSNYPIQIEIVEVILDYLDYENKKIQIIKGKIGDVFVYSGLYTDQAQSVPFKNKEKRI